MKIRLINEAPKDSRLVLVTDEDRLYGPFYLARFLYGQWIVEGTGNGTIAPIYWLDVDSESPQEFMR